MSDPFDTPGIIATIVGGGGIVWLVSEGVIIPIIKWIRRHKKRSVLLLGGFLIVAFGATGFSWATPCLSCAFLYLIVDSAEKKKAAAEAAEAEKQETEARRAAERKARETEARWVREAEAQRIMQERLRVAAAEAERRKAEAYANECRKRQRMKDAEQSVKEERTVAEKRAEEARNAEAARARARARRADEARKVAEEQTTQSVDSRPEWARRMKVNPTTTPFSEVKKRFKRLICLNHPDRGGTNEGAKTVIRWYNEARLFYQSKS
jgi:hypothetical protein